MIVANDLGSIGPLKDRRLPALSSLARNPPVVSAPLAVDYRLTQLPAAPSGEALLDAFGFVDVPLRHT